MDNKVQVIHTALHMVWSEGPAIFIRLLASVYVKYVAKYVTHHRAGRRPMVAVYNKHTINDNIRGKPAPEMLKIDTFLDIFLKSDSHRVLTTHSPNGGKEVEVTSAASYHKG